MKIDAEYWVSIVCLGILTLMLIKTGMLYRMGDILFYGLLISLLLVTGILMRRDA